MKRRLFALLCMVMLVFCLFPLPAEAAEEEINIGEWFSAHPDPQVTELVRESLEYELDGETIGDADFGYILSDGGESVYLLVALTGSGFDQFDWEHPKESTNRCTVYSDDSYDGPEDRTYDYDARAELYLSNIPSDKSAEYGFEELLEMNRESQVVHDLQELTIAGHPAFIYGYSGMWSEIDEVETYESYYESEYRYDGYRNRYYSILLGEMYPGHDLILSGFYSADVHSRTWMETYEEASALSQVFHEKFADAERATEEFQNADYSFTVRMIPAQSGFFMPSFGGEVSDEDYTGDWSYDTDAEEPEGEGTGLLVPAAAVAVIGGGAIIAGKRKKKNRKKSENKEQKKEEKQDEEEQEEQEQFSYSMRIYKDFGDTLNVGAEKLPVYARIVKTDAMGNESTDEKLTSMIRISSPEYLRITDQRRSGEYMSAFVSAPDTDSAPQEAVVEFTMQANGGRFANRVHFKVRETALIFPDQPSYSPEMFIDAIAGDSGTYKVRFFFENAAAEPEKLTGSCEGFDVSFEPAENQFTYYAILKNNTAPSDRRLTSFTEQSAQSVPGSISASFAGGKTLEGSFRVMLYPEGLSASSDSMADGNVLVYSYANENRGELDPEYKSARIDYTLAVRTENGAEYVKLTPSLLKFGELTAQDTISANIAAKYKYSVDKKRLDEGITHFTPATMLYEQQQPVIVTLPVSCTYRGQEYALDIPLYLRGKEIDRMAKWEAEYKKLLFRIVNFSDPEKIQDNLMKARLRCGTPDDPYVSVEDMHLMAKRLIEEYMDYLTKEAESEIVWGIAFDWMASGAEVAKFLGDCAFSFLINAYAGPVADAILSPAKDVFTSAIGEWGVSYIYGTEFELEKLDFVGALYSAGDGIAFNAAQGSIEGLAQNGAYNAAAVKKAAAIIAAYYVYLALANYLKKLNETGESDLWGAMTDAFKDLSMNALKAAASMLFKKWLDSKKFQENLGKKIEEYMQKNFRNLMDTKMNNLQEDWAQKLHMEGELKKLVFADAGETEILRRDIAEKYVTELCGKGAAWIADKAYAGADWLTDKALTSEFGMGADGDILFSFRLWEEEGKKPIYCTISLFEILNNMSCGLFGVIYDMVFGGVPSASNEIEIAKEPQLPH